MMQETVRAHAYQAVIEERISDLWRYRRWYRDNRGWLTGTDGWRDAEAEDALELRALVTIARKARALSAPVIAEMEHPADMTFADLFADHEMHVQRAIVAGECDDCLTLVDNETPVTYLAGWTEPEMREAYGA